MDSIFQKMAARVMGNKTAQGEMGGMPMDPTGGMGGMPMDPSGGMGMGMGGPAPMGGAPAPSAEELMASMGGGMQPAMPPAPMPEPTPPVDEGPDEAELATADALSNMSEAVKNLTDAFLAGKANPVDTVSGIADEMMATPAAELAPQDIDPMIEADAI